MIEPKHERPVEISVRREVPKALATADDKSVLRERATKTVLFAILGIGVLITPVWLGAMLWGLFLIARWLIG